MPAETQKTAFLIYFIISLLHPHMKASFVKKYIVMYNGILLSRVHSDSDKCFCVMTFVILEGF